MELVATGKTNVVCNHYNSKALEVETQAAEGHLPGEASYDTRRSRRTSELYAEDTTVFAPTITVRQEAIEVVPNFRYLGAEDKDDGSLGVEIQAQICRMKQRFKEFEGMIFRNTRISTLPRMQVIKYGDD